jgi:hypothetical protein
MNTWEKICEAEKQWREDAYQMLIAYPGKEFKTEDLREWAYANGLPKPNKEQSWGGIVVRGKKAGIIQQKSIVYGNYLNNPATNPCPCTLWERV